MAGCQFTAKIEHTEKTIESLYRAQYHAYEKPKMIIWMGFALALIFVAAFSPFPSWAKAFILLIGAWLVVSPDFPALVRADRVVEARHGSLPKMEYEFHKDQMKISGEGRMSISYKKIVRLTEDKFYLYIIISKASQFLTTVWASWSDNIILSKHSATAFMAQIATNDFTQHRTTLRT